MIVLLRVIDKRYRFDTDKAHAADARITAFDGPLFNKNQKKLSELSDTELFDRFTGQVAQLWPLPYTQYSRAYAAQTLREMARRGLAQSRMEFDHARAAA